MMNRDALIASDRRHLWRPYTSSEDHERYEPLIVERAEGPYLYDETGRAILDASGSWWCNNLGHRHPRIVDALKRQADRLMHCSFGGSTHETTIALAEELIARAPEGFSRVFFSDNGSSAVEIAAKMAFQYFQQNGAKARRRFLSLSGAYHGDTIGAMSLGSASAFHAVFDPLKFEVVHAPEPEDKSWENVARFIEETLEAEGDQFAALIVEPIVQGAGGMRIYPQDILRRFREATKEAGVLLIVDEVFTGYGRTGPFWAVEHAGVIPDLIAAAKGLSAGALPFAATLATETIYDGFRGDKSRALLHGHTFYGNPLGAAVALETLKIYREENILEIAKERANQLERGMHQLRAIEGVNGVRSIGMVAALELGEDGYFGERGWRASRKALELGAQIRPLGDTLYLVPPLNIPQDALEKLLEITRAAIVHSLEG